MSVRVSEGIRMSDVVKQWWKSVLLVQGVLTGVSKSMAWTLLIMVSKISGFLETTTSTTRISLAMYSRCHVSENIEREISQKKCNYVYTIRTGGKVYKVCRKGFISMHGITEKLLRYALKKKTGPLIPPSPINVAASYPGTRCMNLVLAELKLKNTSDACLSLWATIPHTGSIWRSLPV